MGWAVALLAGCAAGILSGLGVGGGTLLLIYLTLFAGIEQHTAQGINLLYYLSAASAALVSHFKNGFVDKTAALYTAAAGVCTTALSSLVALHTDTALLRKCFGVFLLYIALSLLLRRDKGAR